jgi:phosphoribosylformylglycinamidine (FGAM) synthase PurS component
VTAASVTVSGRVLKPSGKGINRAVVTMSDMMGNVRTATTNQFGYYRFDGVQVGKLYVLEAKAKNYRFDPVFLKVLDVADNVNFTALP